MKKKRIMGLVGIGLIAISVAGLWFWETQLKEDLLYTDILVTSVAVDVGTVLTTEMLTVGRADKALVIDGSVRDHKSIVGKTAQCYIPAGAQLHEKFFTEAELLLGDEEYVFPLPAEWLYSFPQTLRRGDTVYFYTVPAALLESGEAYMPELTGAAEGEGESAEAAPPLQSPEPLLSATVMYVKDNANREIVDVTPERIDASANVSTVEVVVDEAEAQQLLNAFLAGEQFILMYQ